MSARQMLWLLAVALTSVGVSSTEVFAQPRPVAVQLPTFSSFSVLTTVSVPDRGGAYMGGFRRAQSGQSRFGIPLLPGQGARGGNRQAAGLHVSATIHDHRAMDQALLSGGSQVGGRPLGPEALRLTKAGLESAGSALPSVAAIRQRQDAKQSAGNAEALDFLRRGREAQAAGKTNVARIHLQMAARRAAGPLKAEIDALLADLTPPTGKANLAARN